MRRRRRGQHDALDALTVGIKTRNINWVLDADISRFFDTISHDWLVRFIEHRPAPRALRHDGDRRGVRLIQKWLDVGVLEDGVRVASEDGTPQGAVISPLLANIYLHYVYDLWAHQWRRHATACGARRHATGDVIFVRYADDTVVGFENRSDADRFLVDLRVRLAAFALTLHPEKTRLIEFGKHAAHQRAGRGDGKPDTFAPGSSVRAGPLGFTHICGRTKSGPNRPGGFQLWRRSARKRMKAKIRAIKDELRKRMHDPLAEQGKWLGSVVRGFFAYHASWRSTPPA